MSTVNATLRTRVLLVRPHKDTDQSEFLIMRRIHDGHTQWMVPGGGVDPGELSCRAAMRELHEECDIRTSGLEKMIIYGGTILEVPRPKSMWNGLERAYFRDKAPNVTQIEQTSSWWILPVHRDLTVDDIADPTQYIIKEKDKFDKAMWVTTAKLAEMIQNDVVNFDLNPSHIRDMLSCIYWM